MKTIQIDDRLHQLYKTRAARTDIKLNELIERGLQDYSKYWMQPADATPESGCEVCHGIKLYSESRLCSSCHETETILNDLNDHARAHFIRQLAKGS